MESGYDNEQKAGRNLQVWKFLPRKESCLDWESDIRLRRCPNRILKMEIVKMDAAILNQGGYKNKKNSAQHGKRNAQSRLRFKSGPKTHLTTTNPEKAF